MTDPYGPQHPYVVKLIERARRLTGDELQQLAVAVDAAAATRATGKAARAAWAAAAVTRGAGAAAWYAAVDAGVTTADAVTSATWSATRSAGAAECAALALATRHLIGRHGYTRAHYDVLVGPWTRVIGPVHPDDGILLVEAARGEVP